MSTSTSSSSRNDPKPPWPPFLRGESERWWIEGFRPLSPMYENIQFPDTSREARALRAQLGGDDNAFVLDSGHGLAVVPSSAKAGSGTLYQVSGPETRSAAVVYRWIDTDLSATPSSPTGEQGKAQSHVQ
jgi:hypothetical protein